MMPSHVRVFFLSRQVRVYSVSEWAELPSAVLLGARTQWLYEGSPLDGAGRD